MKKEILMVMSDEQQVRVLCKTMENEGYRTIITQALNGLEAMLQESQAGVLLLDLDAAPVENRFLRDLKRQFPDVWIIGLSSRSFHPELKEAMSTHIYASLGKPVDPDELVYWLNSIFETSVDPKGKSP